MTTEKKKDKKHNMVKYNKKGQKKVDSDTSDTMSLRPQTVSSLCPSTYTQKYGKTNVLIEQNKAEAHTTESQISWNRSLG